MTALSNIMDSLTRTPAPIWTPLPTVTFGPSLKNRISIGMQQLAEDKKFFNDKLSFPTC